MNEKARSTIGVFLDQLSDSYHQRYWSGLVQGAKEHDINLLCFTGVYYSSVKFLDYGDHIKTLINLANNNHIDAIINWASTLTWTVTKDNFQNFFENIRRDPSYFKLQSIPDNIPITIMGSYQGFKEITEHLIKVHGFQKIAFIRGPENHLGANERYRAFTETLAEYKIPLDQKLVTPPQTKSWAEKTGEDMMDLLIENSRKDIQAVMAVSDSFAHGALKSLKKHGIKVPDEIVVTGFDDYPFSSLNIPTLTTVDPRFEEVGRRSIDVIMRILNGEEVPQRQYVQPKLILRQSCGCSEEIITTADYIPESKQVLKTEKDDSFKKLICSKREKILDEINYILFSTSIYKNAEVLFESFCKVFESDEKNIFKTKLDELLNQMILLNEDPSGLHQVISILRHNILQLLPDNESIMRAENILQQARIMIAQAALQVQGRLRLAEKEQDDLLEKIEKELITTFDIKMLLDILSEKLPKLGIASCYLSLYEKKNNDKISSKDYEWSRLMMVYNKDKRFDIDRDGIKFPSSELIPKDFLSMENDMKYVIEPLYFQNEQLGFVLFEIGPMQGHVYERLRSDISSAVKGAILMNEMGKRTRELDKAYNDLKFNQQKMITIEKMASLGRLTAGIAHEMNTPLAAVRASLKEIMMLADEYKNSINNPQVIPSDHEEIANEIIKYVEMASKAAEKSASFIRGIKGQTTNLNESILENFNASQVITDTLNLLNFKIKKSSCKLVTNLDNSIVINGNQRWLSQIITNFVNNAIEACSANDCIITVRLCRTSDSKAELTVQDTGEGITQENMSRIFDPLFTTKPFGEATGLGLSIVQELVNHFKGTVSVKSQTGLTTFTVILPLVEK